MTAEKSIGLLGGSFDPIHIGHLIMAENAMEQLKLDRILFAPAGNPPHKLGQSLTSISDRMEMVHKAIAGQPGFICSDIDSDPDEPSFTWLLLERLHEQEPGAEITFIMGGDSLRDFKTWSRPDRILELARLAVVERPGHPFTNDDWRSMPSFRERLSFVESPMCSVSSTEIRDRVRAGSSIRYLVPDPVRRFVERHGLYR